MCSCRGSTSELITRLSTFTMTERDNLTFDHTLAGYRDDLRESEVDATDSLEADRISGDLNHILQNLIKAVENLDERVEELENE